MIINDLYNNLQSGLYIYSAFLYIFFTDDQKKYIYIYIV